MPYTPHSTFVRGTIGVWSLGSKVYIGFGFHRLGFQVEGIVLCNYHLGAGLGEVLVTFLGPKPGKAHFL